MKVALPLKLNCSSIFAPYANEYIEWKQAVGFKMGLGIEVLNQFDKFCLQHSISEPIFTEELMNKWSAKRPYENETNRSLRIGSIRSFAQFLRSKGIPVHCKFHKLPKPEKTFIPYIFTHDEIYRFFKAVDEFSTQCFGSKIRHLVMPLLYRMLYTCGLRIKEALLLKWADVNLDNGTLLLLNTKGNKDRLVPMSNSLTILCRDYCNNKLIKATNSEYFFPARDGGWYDSSTIYDQFRQILAIAGISHGGRGKGPRLHDLRHTFAVHLLAKWTADGKDLYVALPILSTYLGHVELKSSQKYLRLVPEAYTELTGMFEEKFGGVFPKDGDQ